MIRPLRVILPLYNEEIYFLARADSDLNYVHDIRNAKINVGELGSGHRAHDNDTLPVDVRHAGAAGERDLPSERGGAGPSSSPTSRSTSSPSSRGSRTKLLVDMKPEARNLIKLLKFDPSQPASQAALKTYVQATVRASSYPNLLAEDLPGLAVKAFLVTYDFSLEGNRGLAAEVRAVAVPEFPYAAGEGASKMARGRARAARSWPWLDLLPGDDDGATFVHRRKRKTEDPHEQGVYAAGAGAGAVQVAQLSNRS
jgi:hypothetical protein